LVLVEGEALNGESEVEHSSAQAEQSKCKQVPKMRTWWKHNCGNDGQREALLCATKALDWTGRLEEKQQNAPRPKTAATETSSERERRNKS
jgi:hypothetical protein